MSAYIIDKHLTNMINNDLLRNSFSDSTKLASVRSMVKEGERTEIGNYRPVSILKDKYKSCFDKVHWKLENNSRQKCFYWGIFDGLA